MRWSYEVPGQVDLLNGSWSDGAFCEWTPQMQKCAKKWVTVIELGVLLTPVHWLNTASILPIEAEAWLESSGSDSQPSLYFQPLNRCLLPKPPKLAHPYLYIKKSLSPLAAGESVSRNKMCMSCPGWLQVCRQLHRCSWQKTKLSCHTVLHHWPLCWLRNSVRIDRTEEAVWLWLGVC